MLIVVALSKIPPNGFRFWTAASSFFAAPFPFNVLQEFPTLD
jgi:hypothetical protein